MKRYNRWANRTRLSLCFSCPEFPTEHQQLLHAVIVPISYHFEFPTACLYHLLAASNCLMIVSPNVLIQGVLAGKSSGAEGERTFEQKLSDAKAGVQSSGAEGQQAQLKIKHLEKELSGKRKLLAAKQKEATGMEKELEAVSAAVGKCQAALDDLHFDENRVVELKTVRTDRFDNLERREHGCLHGESRRSLPARLCDLTEDA